MSRVAIVSDSNSGITQAEAKELGITVLPMPFFIDDKTLYEDIDLDQAGFYQMLAGDVNISTSMPLVGNLTDAWDELLKEYDGKLAIIYRNYPLTSIHPNAIAAASAVEAAGLQGYWEEMGDLLFANQAEWFYSTGDARTNYFVNYFTSVSKGAGDVAQFKSDLASDRVKAKVNFDKAISESYKLSATPSFIDENGKEIDWTSDVEQTKTGIQAFFRNYINKKLGK